MKRHTPTALSALSLLLAPAAFAGKPVQQDETAPAAAKAASDGKSCPDCKMTKAPWRAWLPDEPAGNFTLGTMVSEDGTGIYLDGITGLWAPESVDKFLFLNTRYHWEEGDQFISSTGLGYRQKLPGKDVIIGGNVFWDAIQSENGNEFAQLGLGVEVLTKWVDFRFNYYLPEDDQYEIGRSSDSSSHTRIGAGRVVQTNQKRYYKDYESSLEGFNTEIGFLIPGLDRYAEVRAYVGYYHYDNPFGGDYDGFKARLEARLLRGVVANVEYWDDAKLMGGHWTGEIAVSVPFSLYNLFTGKNPFEGAGNSFQRLPRPFQDRMEDVVERSHRIQTTTSGNRLTDRSSSRRVLPFGSSGGPGGPSGGGDSGFPIE